MFLLFLYLDRENRIMIHRVELDCGKLVYMTCRTDLPSPSKEHINKIRLLDKELVCTFCCFVHDSFSQAHNWAFFLIMILFDKVILLIHNLKVPAFRLGDEVDRICREFYC